MPIYKMDGKKDGKQKYRVRINYTDRAGSPKQIDRVVYGSEEAKELERQLNHDLKEETQKKCTLLQLSEEYLNTKKYEVRESSLDKMKRRLDYYVLPELGSCRIDKLTVPLLQKWKNGMEERLTSTNEKLSLRTKQSAYCELRAVLNYAVKMEYLQKNPLSSLNNFKDAYAAKSKIDFYTAEEFMQFISESRKAAQTQESITGSIHEWNFYVFFNLAFYTGMRKGEIYALNWTDLNDDILSITKSITQKLKGDDRETPPKNKSSQRSIKIPRPLQKVLKEHFERFSKISGFHESWKICGGKQCIRDTTVQKRNEQYANAANLKIIRIHDFRHSHASLLANNGINIQEIARRLGHSKIEITWNTYSHMYPKEEERAVEILNKIV